MEPQETSTDPSGSERTGARTTRLAPSPTGDLHLGNARTFLLNWLLARRLGWRVLFRHEDLDESRAAPETRDRIERSLAWLGIDWDGPAKRQSDDLEPYREAMRVLGAQRRVYRSDLSRRAIREAMGAPHGGELVFPARLRPTENDAWGFGDETAGHRFAMSDGEESVRDELSGRHRFDPATEAGDPILWTRDGRPGYQLAVVVDDQVDAITDVVRGDDLLPSAARQQRIGIALGRRSPPCWWHLPMIHDEQGRRLSKRDGDHGLAALRARGVRPERIVGLLLHLSGILPERRAISARESVDLIDRDQLRRLVERERNDPCRLESEALTWLES